MAGMLSQLHNLIKYLTHLIEHLGFSTFHGVWAGGAGTPVKRFGLMTENIASGTRFSACCCAGCHGKRVVGIIGCRGHGQPQYQRGALIKLTRRQHQKRMHVAHFTPCLRVAVDPDNVLPFWYPVFWWLDYHFSAPCSSVVFMHSPPWRSGSNLLRRSARLG